MYCELYSCLLCPACQASHLPLSVCVQPLGVVEPHLDGEGSHLQGAGVPAVTTGGEAPAPSRKQVELLNALRTRVFLHEGVPW